MHITKSFRVIACAITLSVTILANSISAYAAEPSTFGKCSFPSTFVLRNLVRQAVVNDLTAKGFKSPSVTVTLLAKNVRTALKLSNVSGLTSVTAKTDGSYQLNTSGPLSVACASEATVRINGAYKDTANVRKTFTGTQTVQINGAFN
jgi:hypothetical protein